MSDQKMEQNDEPKLILVNPLDPMSEYVEFGRYLLSLKQLSKGKFMLKTKNCNPVMSFKTLNLTRKTKGIAQKLLQNIQISFDDIDRLNDEEKEQIDTIAHVTEITDRLKYLILAGQNWNVICTHLIRFAALLLAGMIT